jgi:hypothetical protein
MLVQINRPLKANARDPFVAALIPGNSILEVSDYVSCNVRFHNLAIVQIVQADGTANPVEYVVTASALKRARV